MQPLRSLLSPTGFQTLAPRYGSVLYLPDLLALPIKAPLPTRGVGTQCADKAAKVRTLRQMSTGRTHGMVHMLRSMQVCTRQLAEAGSLTQIIIFLAVRDTAKSCTHMLKPIVAEFTKSLDLWVMLVTLEKA